jgi:hypothetical protein
MLHGYEQKLPKDPIKRKDTSFPGFTIRYMSETLAQRGEMGYWSA